MAQSTRFHLDACPSNSTSLLEDCSCQKEKEHYLRLAKRVLFVSLVELIGGFYSGSTALISEGVHQLLDGTESIVSVIVSHLARESDDENQVRKTGGKISAILLLFAAIWIIAEGAERITTPHPIAWYMILIAIFGFVVTFWLRRTHRKAKKEHHNLTHFWQDWHLMSDLFANGAVIVGGVIMLLTGGLYWIDGVLSIGIGILIMTFTAARLLGFELHSHDHSGHDHGHSHEHGSGCDHKH